MPATATRSKKSKSNRDIYQEVTNKIIEALEQGVVPWRKPWKNLGVPHQNLVSKRPYRGVNPFLLEVAALLGGWDSPYWLSFKQAKEKGGKVKKGEKGTLVAFWKILRIETDEKDEKGKAKYKTIPLLRHYVVFNTDQCEGIEVPPQPTELDFNPIERAQEIMDNMPERPKTIHGGDHASYAPGLDRVRLPKPQAFDHPENYYKTGYHEYVHSTGHEDRLHRIKDWSNFGSEPYANEELVAEMGAAMLCGVAAIEAHYDNSAAYVANWLERLKNDPKLVVTAAAQAQRAADFILGEYDLEGNGNGSK